MPAYIMAGLIIAGSFMFAWPFGVAASVIVAALFAAVLVRSRKS